MSASRGAVSQPSGHRPRGRGPRYTWEAIRPERKKKESMPVGVEPTPPRLNTECSTLLATGAHPSRLRTGLGAQLRPGSKFSAPSSHGFLRKPQSSEQRRTSHKMWGYANRGIEHS